MTKFFWSSSGKYTVVIFCKLGDSDRFLLETARSNILVCPWSGERIEEGDLVVSISAKYMDDAKHFLSQVKVSNIDEVHHHIKEFNPSKYHSSQEISPSGTIKYVPKHLVPRHRAHQTDCPVCKENTSENEDGVIIIGTAVAIHTNCVPKFVSIIEDVWNHSDTILEESLE